MYSFTYIPLYANFTKWSNTPKQFIGKLLTNFLNVFTILWDRRLMGYCNLLPNRCFRLILMIMNWKLVYVEPHSDVRDSSYF